MWTYLFSLSHCVIYIIHSFGLKHAEWVGYFAGWAFWLAWITENLGMMVLALICNRENNPRRSNNLLWKSHHESGIASSDSDGAADYTSSKDHQHLSAIKVDDANVPQELWEHSLLKRTSMLTQKQTSMNVWTSLGFSTMEVETECHTFCLHVDKDSVDHNCTSRN